MSDQRSYAPHVQLGAVMVGSVVGEVVDSRAAGLKPGDKVIAPLGWQLCGVVPANRVRKIEQPIAPLSAYLGILGMPAITAWVGLQLLGGVQAGQTLLVSAATGAVGSAVGQIARLRAARVIGIAGGADKCSHALADLGLSACVDYQANSFDEDLQNAAASGIDFNFENVGGRIFDAVLGLLNPFARVALCGQVSQYSATLPYPMRNLRSLLVNRVTLRGFIVSDHMDLWPQALHELTQWFTAGKLSYRETIAQGLDSAPKAFIALLSGDKIGKQLVELDES